MPYVLSAKLPQPTRIHGVTSACLLGILLTCSVCRSQDTAVLEPRTTQKPVVSNTVSGATYVALTRGLEEIFQGREPSTLAELRALEAQQSKVAKSIENVTVNVQQGSAQGSGVIITGDGFVLTAAHVAGGAGRTAWVLLSDGTRLKAETLGMNRNKDAGLIKIVDKRSTPFPHATLGTSADLKVGQWCIGSGHPGGWQPDRGAVIRVGRILKISHDGDRSDAHTLFTDCALIGGDSGGPLFTLEGKLIGIHSRIGTDVAENMHVPIDVYAKNWDRMARKEVWGVLPGFRPIIGIKGPIDNSPLVAEVTVGGPSEGVLLVGDRILTINDATIEDFGDVKLAVQAASPGDVLIIKVQRGEQVLRLPVKVGVDEGN